MSTSIPSPLETILLDIEQALQSQLYYLALSVALTIPGICAALEMPSGSTAGQDAMAYKRWYNAHLSPKYPNLTDTDCYSLRCGVVHQGRLGDPAKMQYARVLFTLPNSQRNVFHNNILADALNLDLLIFCRDIVNAARNWLISKSTDIAVQANISLLVRFRPQGLSPYMVGTPLIS